MRKNLRLYLAVLAIFAYLFFDDIIKSLFYLNQLGRIIVAVAADCWLALLHRLTVFNAKIINFKKLIN